MSAAPADPGKLFQEAEFLCGAGRLDEAVLKLGEAIRVDPDSVPAHRLLGVILTKKGDHEGAIRELQAALRVDPKNPFLHQLLGDATPSPESKPRLPETMTLAGAQETLTLHGEGAIPAAAPPAGLPVDWRPGEVIGGLYEVKSQLGVGGFGSVHKVYHRGWGLDLAVKSPRADRVSNRRALERFVQEANTWVGLGLHPHIVACFFVRLMGVPRIFIEYMEGGSLWDWLQDGRVKDASTALDIAVQIARAMEYAHGRGLVHRDLKPGNCLMTPGGTLKVTDFGLAKVGGEDDDDPEADAAPHGARIARVRDATQTGRLGTPEYMAPEQWHKSKEAGAGADAWAFGIILHELFRGRKPFVMAEGEPVDAFHARQLDGGWAFDKPGELPGRVAELLTMCLMPDPTRRLADFKRIGAMLESAYERITGKSYPREAAKESPLLADTLVNQGVSMADLGRTDEALRLFGEALKLDPTHPGALYDQGLLLIEAGNLTEAALLTRLAESKKARTGEWTASYLMGLVQLRRRDAPAALKELDEAVAASHSDPLVMRAHAMARAREFDRAAEIFVTLPRGTESARMEEAVFGALLSRAKAEADAGEPSKACETLKKARAVKGYERHSAALEVGRRLGSLGVRTGLRAGWQRRVFEDSAGALCLSVTPDGKLVLSGHPDQTARLWDASTGRCIRTFKGFDGAVNCVCATPDGNAAVCGSAKGTLRLWELATGKDLGLFARHEGAVRSVCLSPDGRYSLSAQEDDHSLHLREFGTDKSETLPGHAGPVNSACFSADGRHALSAGEDKSMRLWEVASRQCARILAHDLPVRSACMTPDGVFALSMDSAATFRLWELASGRCVKTVATAGSKGICLTPDGRFALSAGEDKTLGVWELPSGRKVGALAGHNEGMTSLCCGPDGSFAFTAGADAIMSWELEWDYSFPNRRDWDEGARIHLEAFLATHSPSGAGSAADAAGWSEEQCRGLLADLGRRGYGWLKPEGVLAKLKALSAVKAAAPKPPPVRNSLRLAAAATLALSLAFAWHSMRGRPASVTEAEKPAVSAAKAGPPPLQAAPTPPPASPTRIDPIREGLRKTLESVYRDLVLAYSKALFRPTMKRYSEKDDLEEAVRKELGPGFRVADWNDLLPLKGWMEVFVDAVGLKKGDNLLVTKDGNHFWRERRHYFITRFDHIKDDNYLAHADLDDQFVTLGSWYDVSFRVLAFNKEAAKKTAAGNAASTPGGVEKGEGGVEWVSMPGGTFMMGSESEPFVANANQESNQVPVHRVAVRAFQIAKTEVTFGQYRKCVLAGACTPAHVSDGTCVLGDGETKGKLPASFLGGDQPVVCVNWAQAQAFARWVGGRLPSEAEWEYAGRSAGRNIDYPWGELGPTCKRAVMDGGVKGCGRRSTWPVCSKPLGNTRQGLCDMTGNACEWMQDSYHDSYAGAPGDGSAWEGGANEIRVLRGCSWDADAFAVGSMLRLYGPSDSFSASVGLRPARDLPASAYPDGARQPGPSNPLPMQTGAPAGQGVLVSGHVYSAKAMAGIKVDLVRYESKDDVVRYESVVQTTTSDSEGFFRFSGVKPGKYMFKYWGPTDEYIGEQGTFVEVGTVSLVEDLDLVKKIRLLSPASGGVIDTQHPTLRWMPNPEAVRYSVQINKTEGWKLVEHQQDVRSTSHIVQAALEHNSNYTWQVEAYGANGHHIGSTYEAFTFRFVSP